MKYRVNHSHIETYTEPGSPTKPVYKLRYDKVNREHNLVEVGIMNLQEEIESHKDSVDLNLILERFANGDVNAINRVQTFYGDFTNLPTNINDIANRMLELNDIFNTLPKDIKQEFNNNPTAFFSAIGTEEYKKAVNTVMERDLNQIKIKPVENREETNAE